MRRAWLLAGLLGACADPFALPEGLDPEPTVWPAHVSADALRDCVGLDARIETAVRWVLVDSLPLREVCPTTLGCAGYYRHDTRTAYIVRRYAVDPGIWRHEGLHALYDLTGRDSDPEHRSPDWARCVHILPSSPQP
jgi:hypothetical protein